VVFDGRWASVTALGAPDGELYRVVRVGNKPTDSSTLLSREGRFDGDTGEWRSDVARFRAEMDDGSTRHLDADRLVIDDVVRLERRHGDSWITWVSMDPSEVTSVSRRHTELNGSWSWVRVYPATGTEPRKTVPTWERSW